MSAQTLAATNRHLRPTVMAALASRIAAGAAASGEYELPDGAGTVLVSIAAAPGGGIFAEVRDARTGGHFGTWQINLRAI